MFSRAVTLFFIYKLSLNSKRLLDGDNLALALIFCQHSVKITMNLFGALVINLQVKLVLVEYSIDVICRWSQIQTRVPMRYRVSDMKSAWERSINFIFMKREQKLKNFKKICMSDPKSALKAAKPLESQRHSTVVARCKNSQQPCTNFPATKLKKKQN